MCMLVSFVLFIADIWRQFELYGNSKALDEQHISEITGINVDIVGIVVQVNRIFKQFQ